MKPLLLIVIIHLLIFHQHRKDKNEALAPKKNKPLKTAVPSYNQNYLHQDIEIKSKDSLEFSYKSKSLNYDYVNYQYKIK